MPDFLTLPLVLLLMLQANGPVGNLKTVELAGRYTIQVPANFVVHPLVSSVPAIAFWSDVDNRRTDFNVTVEQYGGNTTIVVDKASRTSRFQGIGRFTTGGMLSTMRTNVP